MARKRTVTGGREATTGVIPGLYALSVGDPGSLPPEGFHWTSLPSVARLESGHTPSRRHPEYWGGRIPWIGIRDATSNHGRRITATQECVTEEGIANSSARLLPANTVCLSRTASVGYVVMMGGPMATSQDFVNWVCGHALNPRYLLYIFLAEQSSIRRFAHGSTHQTMYYPEAKALHVCIPERRYQDEVVEVLGALDDKIEANLNVARVERLLGASLLEQARRSGTTCVALEEASASIARGVAPRYSATGTGVLVLNQKCIRDGEVSLDFARWMDHRTSKAERVARHGDVLVNSTGMGTLGRAARWIGESAIDVDSHISIIRPNPEKCHPAVLAWAVIAAQDELESLAEGSTGQTELSRTRLSSLTIDIPKSGIDRLGDTLAAIDGHCWQLGQERRTLAQLRDTLLPKLISGDLRVRDAEAALEAAS